MIPTRSALIASTVALCVTGAACAGKKLCEACQQSTECASRLCSQGVCSSGCANDQECEASPIAWCNVSICSCSPRPDAGAADSGIVASDAGAPDSGRPDAGPVDAGSPDASVDAGGTPGPDAGPDAGPPDAGPPPINVTEVCAWGSFGCLACCELTAFGLSCSAPVDCSALLGSVTTKSFPGGPSFAIVGDYGGGGAAVYQIDPSVSPPTLTPVFSVPSLTILNLVTFGDPYLYAQAHVPDAGGVNATNSLYEYGIGSNGSLTPLSPPLVNGLAQGQPVVDPTTGHMYMVDFNDVGQCQVQDGGQVASLSPATVPIAGTGYTSRGIVLAPSLSTLYVGTVQNYLDGGQQPMISQFSVQSDGTLAPAPTPTVNIPYQADSIAVVAPPGGAAAFVYVLGHDTAFTSHLNQYTVSGGTLVPNTPASITVCNPSFTMTVTPDQSLLLVACTTASQVAAYTIGANGTLSPTNWSPATMTVAPGQLSIFTTR